MPDSVLMPAPVKKSERRLRSSSARSDSMLTAVSAVCVVLRRFQLDLVAQGRFQPVVHRDDAVALVGLAVGLVIAGQARVDADDDAGALVDDWCAGRDAARIHVVREARDVHAFGAALVRYAARL